jgi:hypothetical protein
MLVTIQSRTFRVLIYCLKTQKLEYTKLQFLPEVLYGCGTWSLILKEEYRLRVFQKRVLRRIFALKRDELAEVGENCIMRSFITCNLHQV